MLLKPVLKYGLLSCVLLCLPVSTASAQETYTYTGNNFTTVFGGYTTAMGINKSVTLSITLGPNLVDFDAAPFVTALTISDGFYSFTEATPFSFSEFRVSTNAVGNIQNWNIEYRRLADRWMHSCNDPTPKTLTSAGQCAFKNVAQDLGQHNTVDRGHNTGIPGTWTIGLAPLPAVPLLAPWSLLFLSGLMIALGLAGLGWRGPAKHA